MTSTLLRRPLAALVLALLALSGLTLPAYAGGDPNTVVGWGYDGGGQAAVPASLDGKTVTAISAGDGHFLALTADGKVTAWGYNGSAGLDVPASLDDKTVTAISAGGEHSLALTSDGKVTAWGYNPYGQTNVPASLDDKTVTAVAAGYMHSLALTSDGKVTAWGYNGYGQTNVPASLDGKTVTAIAAGVWDSMALTSDGKVTAWGYNGYGQTSVPASLDGKTVTAIALGYQHALALTSDGKVTAWGSSSYGASAVPASLDDKTVTAISSTFIHSLALTSDGKVVAWGYNGNGQTNVPASLDAKTATGIAAGWNDSLAIVNALNLSGSVSVSGTPTVGQTLTADSTVTSTPEATMSGQWLRDGETIDGATDSTYELVNADAGHKLSYRVTASKDGYQDVSRTSEETAVVDGGQITLPKPTVSGTPVVGATLTGSVDGVDPADAGLSYAWTRGETLVGSDASYQVQPADAGDTLTLTVTAKKAHFDDNSSSYTTDVVAKADFETGPTASITGTAKVGEELTAGAGEASPTPDSLSYQWYADGEAIKGATDSTFTLTSAQKHTKVSVKVTAVKVGYNDASDTSELTGDVATDQAPSIDLSATKDTIRRGQGTTLTWSSEETTGLTASDGWSGAKALQGSEGVAPTTLGTTTYTLSATNENGTTTATATVTVIREAKALKVSAPNGRIKLGSRIKVTASGLDAGESFVIKISGTKVRTGTATDQGTISQVVTVPRTNHDGPVRVRVDGSETDRTGRDLIFVVNR